MSDLYRIDWKKLTEGLDEEVLLYIEGCVEGATIDYEAAIEYALSGVEMGRVLYTESEYMQAMEAQVRGIIDAAVGEDTPRPADL